MPESVAVLEPNPTLIESHPAPPKDVGKLGATDRTSSFAQKYHKAFAELEPPQPDAQHKEEPKPATKEATETTETVETKPDTGDKIATSKPESPLDVVLDKSKKEEPKPSQKLEITAETLNELDAIEKPKPDDWKKAREIRRELFNQVESLKSTPKSDPAIATRVQELEAALADRDTRLKAAGAEYSPDYQALVGKYQGTAEKIKTRMQSYGADGDSLLTALSLPYSKARTDQIDAALEGLDAGKQARVQTLIEQLEGHGEEISEFRKDLPARYEEMTAKQEQAAREQHANAIKQLETEFVKISETLPDNIATLREVPDDVPGGTEWNKEITEARANALRILKPDGSDFNESAAIAFKGARYDSLEKRYLALHKDHVELKKQMREYDGSAPDFKGGTKPTKTSDKKPAQKFHETLNAIKRGELADV